MRHIHKRVVLKRNDPKCAKDHLLIIHRFNTAMDILIGLGKPGVYQDFAWWDEDKHVHGEYTSAVNEMEDALTDILCAFGYTLGDGVVKVGEVKTPAKQKILLDPPKDSTQKKKDMKKVGQVKTPAKRGKTLVDDPGPATDIVLSQDHRAMTQGPRRR